MKIRSTRSVLLAGIAAFLPAGIAVAGESDVYDLGQIHVTADKERWSIFDRFGGTVVTDEQTQLHAKETLDRAVDLAPGVVSNNSGGTRNEQLIFVHGFDRFQVPLSIDGVRVYLPADNRLDFGRFLTGDIAEIQIAKGYASVLDGPGAMGGAINLVTRKPTRSYEGEMRVGTEFGNDGTYDGVKTYLRAGTKQEAYWAQISGTFNRMAGWELPQSYNPTAYENGGRRDHSDTRDWNVNAKVGFTPNATDEYSIAYTKQEGEKNAPYNTLVSTNRYWSWPEWNVQNLAFNSTTAIGDKSYVKTRLFYTTFDNTLDSWGDAAQTRHTNAGYVFTSYYRDWSAGGSVEAGTELFGRDTLKGALHYRRDNHTEWNANYTNASGTSAGCTVNVVCFTEPKQTTLEDTWSLALENTYRLTPSVDLVQGISYDWRKLWQSEDFTSGAYVHYPLRDKTAFNWQMAAIWRYAEDAKIYANVSDRTRFPTLFERFSSRFGGAVSNPGLEPERAINYKLGWTKAYAPKSQVSVEAYYASVQDMIQSVPIVYSGSSVTQYQNVGDGWYAGVDLAVDHALRSDLIVGGNLSLIERKVTAPYIPGFQATDVPELKGLVYASWNPIPTVTLTPNVEFASARWTSRTVGTTTTYLRSGGYGLANVSAEYRIHSNLTLAAGARNIFDQYYMPSDGFPARGRSFFASLKATF